MACIVVHCKNVRIRRNGIRNILSDDATYPVHESLAIRRFTVTWYAFRRIVFKWEFVVITQFFPSLNVFLCVYYYSFVFICSDDLGVAVGRTACINVAGNVSQFGGITYCMFVYAELVVTDFSPEVGH